MYSKFNVTCLSEHNKELQTRNSRKTARIHTNPAQIYANYISRIIINAYLIIKHVCKFEITDVRVIKNHSYNVGLVVNNIF